MYIYLCFTHVHMYFYTYISGVKERLVAEALLHCLRIQHRKRHLPRESEPALYTNTHTHTHTKTHICMYIYGNMYMYIFVYMFMYIYKHISIHMFVYIYICIRIFISICISGVEEGLVAEALLHCLRIQRRKRHLPRESERTLEGEFSRESGRDFIRERERERLLARESERERLLD